MNYSQFLQQLPTLYDRWEQPTITPKLDRFAAILELGGRTTANMLQLLNAAVAELELGEIYCEIGCGPGTTVIGALLGQDDRLAYAVDNLTDRDPTCETALQLSQNLAAFGLEEQVFFCDQDFEAFFTDLRDLQPEEQIGVYFYNGPHDYRSQLLALLLVKPFLAEQALIVIGESNWEMGQQATLDFLAAHPQSKLVLDLSTPTIDHPSFGNGIQVLSWNAQGKNWETTAQASHPAVIAAIADLQDWKFLLQEAQTLQEAGQLVESKQRYLELVQWQDDRPEIWHGLGQVLEALKDILGAAGAYQQAIAIDPQAIAVHNSLGNLVAQHGDPDQAVHIYQQAIAIDPTYLGAYLNLGNVLLVLGQAGAAIAAYESALAIEPQNPDVLHNLSLARELTADETQLYLFAGPQLYDRQRYAQAAPYLQFLVDRAISNPSVYESLSACYEKLHRMEAAIATAQAGVNFHATPSLHLRLIRLWVDFGQIRLALDQADRACEQFPDHSTLRLKQRLLLPIVYSASAEIPIHRDRFTQGLAALMRELPPKSALAIDAISNHTNFFLNYQGQNDRELQRQYGQWVHEMMAARYPQWAQPLAMPAVTEKIRIGYVSGCLHEHTVGKLIIGWFRHHDRDRFQIHSYQVFAAEDGLTAEFRQHSDRFSSFSEDLEAICTQIRADQPHILVFPEIGMQPLMTQLAALRLAPVQCTTWAHPITSGLPTVDYFLSSDLMEPEDGATHYTERLIRLPNLGIAFAKPEIPPPTKTRSDFGLRSDAVVYLLSQTLCKILPHQDRVLVAIAQQVPQAQFVLVSRPNAAIGTQVQQRLQAAFAAAGLERDRILMLPPQNQTDFWNLNQVCDGFLDSFGWSGGHTTLEAIACDLPIVTLPGEFMRSRHSYAILRMLGVTETIAASEADYIQIAVRLGLDPAWRIQLVQTMRDRHNQLYDDRTCIQGMESFYQQVVEQ
jgi:protein O-GlcNAc transferase